MAADDEGFRNDALREALARALAGQPAELERLFCRLGAVLTDRPNLKLAAAFGAEMAAHPGPAAPLLARLGGDDAAPDTDRVFLPIAAAHGWAGRIRGGREVAAAWSGLEELAADERFPIQRGTVEVLASIAARPGGAAELIARAEAWLETDDRERRHAAAAVVVETLADRRVALDAATDEPLRRYLSALLAEIERSPRSSSRSDARRRLLTALPRTLATVVAADGRTDAGRRWLAEECTQAAHPDLREVLSNAILALRAPAHGQTTAHVETLRRALEGSAKPLRDPTRLRPGTGRGKASRRTR